MARFAQSWLRIGSFDILRVRGDRDLIRKLATYIAEDVFPGWESLPASLPDSEEEFAASVDNPERNIPSHMAEGDREENRFTRLYREIARRNAKTVAEWQAYGFMNGVLNTDNTSIYGLSLDYGPFAFMDNFDPSYTPNHDDHMLRYSYKNQPTIIWWNLVRLGESLGELIGAGNQVDDETFVTRGVTEEFAQILIRRAEDIIVRTGTEFRTVFLNEYKRLMGRRLGLRSQKESDFQLLYSELLDTLEALELDFNHFFRRLSELTLDDVETEEKRKAVAKVFFHNEGVGGIGNTEESARQRISQWLDSWRLRILEDWTREQDAERQTAMKSVNPKVRLSLFLSFCQYQLRVNMIYQFLPRGWILEEVIERVERKGDRCILDRVMQMSLNPFNDEWGLDKEEEGRFCGDVPRFQRALLCSCSS